MSRDSLSSGIRVLAFAFWHSRSGILCILCILTSMTLLLFVITTGHYHWTLPLGFLGKEACLEMMGAAYRLLTAAGFTNLRDYHL